MQWDIVPQLQFKCCDSEYSIQYINCGVHDITVSRLAKSQKYVSGDDGGSGFPFSSSSATLNINETQTFTKNGDGSDFSIAITATDTLETIRDNLIMQVTILVLAHQSLQVPEDETTPAYYLSLTAKDSGLIMALPSPVTQQINLILQ